jgi:hypothetical protein
MQFTITLKSGATIGLSKSQEKQVADIVFGGEKIEVAHQPIIKTSTKKRRRAAYGRKEWTLGEDAKIRAMVHTVGRMTSGGARILANDLGRTVASVYSRYQTHHKAKNLLTD